ncbi:peptide signal protein [Acinetobacter sp. ANC 3781]|uniref:hypothetical protein n=1 Tax=Acinetobacter sp. ANC 3781 TaxID=2529835 RepID=UPI0010397BFA|nr:hypothetical protein [Acinetobacter sp. ANC 3781]TCB80261.1 peptide signal protein [Acinetobacter sp. ANC 3781]
MLKAFTLTACLLGLSDLTMAQETTEQSDLHICAIKSTPDSSQFQVKKRIKVAKGTYGSVEELYSRFAERAHQVGGNVVINYNASQRFGFWPWRMVRPVILGTAVKWNTPVNCVAMGGVEI